MEKLTPIDLNLRSKLKDKKYRHRFFKQRLYNEVVIQIKNLRKKRNLTQQELSYSIGLNQSAVARIENVGYEGKSVKSLLKIAEGLDCRLEIIFTPMEEIIKEYERRKL